MSQKRAKKVAKRAAKKKKKAKQGLRTPRIRSCGSCFACCVKFSVDGLPGYGGETKPEGEPCKHLTDNEEARCGIHHRRPHVCRKYKCVWLRDGDHNPRQMFAFERPDKIGAIFDLLEESHPVYKALGKPVLVVRPIREDARKELGLRNTINRFLDRGIVVVFVKEGGGYEFLASNPQDATIVSDVYRQMQAFEVVC